MELWNYLILHWGYISFAVVVVLKWTYNAWSPEGVSFKQFVRNFIGEVIQENPNNLGALPPAEKQAVMSVRAKEPLNKV
jgi:hypothetical protein